MSKRIPQSKVADNIRDLLVEFKLTSAAEELVSRLVQADLKAALPVILEVLEHEREVRHQRRVDRLRRSSKLATGKTFETFDDKRLSRTVVRRLDELRTGEFLDNAVNVRIRSASHVVTMAGSGAIPDRVERRIYRV